MLFFFHYSPAHQPIGMQQYRIYTLEGCLQSSLYNVSYIRNKSRLCWLVKYFIVHNLTR